jgi:hypothetical protein
VEEAMECLYQDQEEFEFTTQLTLSEQQWNQVHQLMLYLLWQRATSNLQ